MLKIVILYGAIRNGRQSIRAAKAIEIAFSAAGVVTTLVDLRDFKLPVMEDRLKDMTDPPPELSRMGRIIEEADGIVFVSPEYNNTK